MEFADIIAARERTAGWIRCTPWMPLEQGWLPGRASFKLEMTQHTGTFKARGALNRILAADERGELDHEVGIVAASGGNAGLANAYAAAQLGVPATVFVPTISSPTKVARLRQYGAAVVEVGSEYSEAYDAAMEEVSRTHALFCHAYDQLEIVAGAGTLGLELLGQTHDEVDTVLVAVGGGGLVAGVATALEGRATVIGVEPVNTATLHGALEAGRPVDVPVSGVAADSLGARRLGDIAWDVVTRIGVHSLVVSDDDLMSARQMLWDRCRLVVEPGAAAALAAVTSGAYKPEDDERVAIVLCGANTDPSDLAQTR